MAQRDFDDELRAAALSYVQRLKDVGGGIVRFRDLDSFSFNGQRVPLIQRPRGIRAIPGIPAALTILTTFRADPSERPYDDVEGEDGYLRYKWMATNPDSRDNSSLRTAMVEEKPLIWFFGVAPGEYEAVLPVYAVAEEPGLHQFVIAMNEALREQWEIDPIHPVDIALRREYALIQTRQRIHQPIFRRRVLMAYGSECALCRLRHVELLDAAHIKEDADGGEPVVPNGVAMCAIHHRAFDSFVVGIRPDYIVEIRPDVLTEEDGPTLRHSLQGLHLEPITVPRQVAARPDAGLLEERFERFRTAS